MAEFGKDPWTDFGVSGSEQETPQTKRIAAAYKQLLDENPTPSGFRVAFHEALKDDKNVLSILRDRKKNNK
jgi:hypothetical protein